MTTLLVTGSRALAETPAARWWATQQILRALAALPLGSTVVTGDASGPDEWTRGLVGAARGAPRTLSLEVYLCTGGVSLSPIPAGCDQRWWTETHYPPRPTTRDAWRERLLARDRAMVQEVAGREGERRCLALVAPWSRTQGTAYTARHARDAGIVVERLKCPLECWPEVTRDRP